MRRFALAVAGLNGRGGSHVGEFVKMPGVEITYLVDPDTRTYGKRLEEIQKQGGRAAGDRARHSPRAR